MRGRIIVVLSTRHQKIGTLWSLKLIPTEKSPMESITATHLEKSITKLFSGIMIFLVQCFQTHIRTHLITFQTTNFPFLVAQGMRSLELFEYIISNGSKESRCHHGSKEFQSIIFMVSRRSILKISLVFGWPDVNNVFSKNCNFIRVSCLTYFALCWNIFRKPYNWWKSNLCWYTYTE